jgi:hypothetical protein
VEVVRGERVKAGKPEHQKAYEGARREIMDGTMVDCLDCNSPLTTLAPQCGRGKKYYPSMSSLCSLHLCGQICYDAESGRAEIPHQ